MFFLSTIFYYVASFGEQTAKQENGSCTSRFELCYVCILSPLQTVSSSSFSSQNGAFDAEEHYCPSKSPHTLYCPPFQPFSGIMSRGFGCFPVGERKEKEKVRNIKVAVVIEKGSCKLTDDEENIHIHSHTNSRYRCIISPAHFDHFYTQMDTLGRC